MANAMYKEAVEAARRGQRDRARDLITRLLRTEKNSPNLWLLMSSVVDTEKERIYCLQSVLKLDPENLAARQGLILLGALPPDESLDPGPPARRKWEVEVDEGEELTGLRKLMANPVVRDDLCGCHPFCGGAGADWDFRPEGHYFWPAPDDYPTHLDPYRHRDVYPYPAGQNLYTYT